MTTRIMKFFLLTYVQKQQAKGKYQFMKFDNLIVGGGKIWTLHVFIRNTRKCRMNYKAIVLLLDYLCWLLFAILEFCVKAYHGKLVYACLFVSLQFWSSKAVGTY